MKNAFNFLIVLSFLSFPVGALTANDYHQFIFENEKNLNEIYFQKYEVITEIFSDRLNKEGQPISVRDFIRPEETKEIVRYLELKNDVKQKIKIIHSYILQNFQFIPDEENEDYWQYPAETIKRGKGDCEDLTFLVASMLIEGGIPEEFVRVNIKNWHVYTTVEIEGEILVLETDPNPQSFYLYEWPQYRWNRQIIERRIKKDNKE